MTQCERIMTHMDKYGSITAMDAMYLYGIMRLASRMSELKEEGYQFYTETVRGRNRYGDTTCYARYIKGEKDVH